MELMDRAQDAAAQAFKALKEAVTPSGATSTGTPYSPSE